MNGDKTKKKYKIKYAVQEFRNHVTTSAHCHLWHIRAISSFTGSLSGALQYNIDLNSIIIVHRHSTCVH